MQRLFPEKASRWLLPAVLIMLILELMTLPFVLGITYAGRGESPDHILTYTEGKLTWDSSTGIDENGVAELDLFKTMYGDVKSQNDDNVIAPGTEGYNIVRLKNSVNDSVKYTAVIYNKRTDEQLPVVPVLVGSNFKETTEYSLPAGVEPYQVVRAVTGTLQGGEIKDFDISWDWQFEVSELQDSIDTFLGNKENADEVVAGLYVVVEDNNSYVSAGSPKTGDNSYIGMYLGLMMISFVLFLLLLWDRHRAKKCQ